MSPQPSKPEMVTCPSCGAQNDPSRGSNRCVSCQLPLATVILGEPLRLVFIDDEPAYLSGELALTGGA